MIEQLDLIAHLAGLFALSEWPEDVPFTCREIFDTDVERRIAGGQAFEHAEAEAFDAILVRMRGC